MRILLIGNGAREHAMALKLASSKYLSKLFGWPAHPLIKKIAEPLNLPPNADFLTLGKEALAQKIDAVICGPETPLAQGLADTLRKISIPTFGPLKEAAQLESSKAFAKEIMAESSIPTADFTISRSEKESLGIAMSLLKKDGSAVLKASGLAFGKGVFVCKSEKEIKDALSRLYGPNMKEASQILVIESMLEGKECSHFAMISEKGADFLGLAVDFKRLKDKDQGPNTGGMGSYSPVPWLPQDASEQIKQKVITPLLRTLAHKKIQYTGFLFTGLMWTKTGPQVIEFNVRLGDPETQALSLSDPTDWLDKICVHLGLSAKKIAPSSLSPRKSVAVVMASSGYPYGELPEKQTILPHKVLEATDRIKVFGAAVSEKEGEIYSGKGRVLTIVGSGSNLSEARENAYERVREISKIWPEAQWRKDIAEQATQEEGMIN